jgi:hypothetical protein
MWKINSRCIINSHNYFWYIYSTVHNTTYECGHEPWIQDRWRNCLRHVRPSARLPLDRLKWNLVLGDSIKICSEIPIFVILGKNCREPYCTPKYVLLLLQYRYARRRLGVSRGQIRTTWRITLKLHNDQRNAQVFKNLFIYLLLPYMFRAPGADTIPRRLEPLLNLYTCLWGWAKRKPETCKAKVNR